jgi:hypothetical protein
MNPELIVQYDAAAEALDAYADAGHEDLASLEQRLRGDLPGEQVGSRSWLEQRVNAPLNALRLFKELHLQVVAAFRELPSELSRLEAAIVALRREGRQAEAAPYERRRVELLHHQACLTPRLDVRRQTRLAVAQRGATRTLEVSLGVAAHEAAQEARAALTETSARLRRALGRIDGYCRLAEEASGLAVGLRAPRFVAEDVTRMRSAAGFRCVRLEALDAAQPVGSSRHARSPSSADSGRDAGIVPPTPR